MKFSLIVKLGTIASVELTALSGAWEDGTPQRCASRNDEYDGVYEGQIAAPVAAGVREPEPDDVRDLMDEGFENIMRYAVNGKTGLESEA